MSGKSSESAAGGQNPMARDDESDGIPCQRLTDGAGCGGPAQGKGKLAVCAGLPGRDFSCGFVHLPRKPTRAVHINGDIPKILNVTPEVPTHSLHDLGNVRRRRARFARARVPSDSRFSHLRRRFWKMQEGHPRRGAGTLTFTPGDPARPQWRFKEAVVCGPSDCRHRHTSCSSTGAGPTPTPPSGLLDCCTARRERNSWRKLRLSWTGRWPRALRTVPQATSRRACWPRAAAGRSPMLSVLPVRKIALSKSSTRTSSSPSSLRAAFSAAPRRGAS